MSEEVLAFSTAVWLGILTSVSPCPLATNIAAISFVGKRLGRTRHILVSGLLYALGRILAYIAIAIVLTAGILSVTDLSFALLKYMNKVLGPLLIIVGMILLGMISVRLPGQGFGTRAQNRVERWGIWGALPLGFIFALSFCPVSAALFFGSLIPLALRAESPIGLPVLYGIGTALPVIAFAVALTFGTNVVGRIFERTTQLEQWARRITGILFILIGIYFCLRYVFELF